MHSMPSRFSTCTHVSTMKHSTVGQLATGSESACPHTTLTCMRRFAVAGEMSTAFWKQSFAAEELPLLKCTAARSRCSLLALQTMN
jgi:hypothetical protein